MDIKSTVLIIVNLVLVETLLSFHFALLTGVLLDKLQSLNKRKHLLFVVFFTKLLYALLLVFASWLIRGAVWKEILLGGIMIYFAIEGLFLKKSNKISRLKFYLITMLFALLTILESILFDDFSAIIAFTDNIYLILFGLLISMISFYWLAKLFEKMAFKSILIRLLGYGVLLVSGFKIIWLAIDFIGFHDPEYFYRSYEILDLYISLFFLVAVIFAFIVDRLKISFSKN